MRNKRDKVIEDLLFRINLTFDEFRNEPVSKSIGKTYFSKWSINIYAEKDSIAGGKTVLFPPMVCHNNIFVLTMQEKWSIQSTKSYFSSYCQNIVFPASLRFSNTGYLTGTFGGKNSVYKNGCDIISMKSEISDGSTVNVKGQTVFH